MKTFNEYIFEYQTYLSYLEIDNELITEKLNDPKLLELAKYLKQFSSKNSYNDKSFSGIFGKYNIEWDKIQESDWNKIENLKEAQKYIGKINSNSSNKYLRGIILIERNKKISGLFSYKTYIDFYNNRVEYDYDNGTYSNVKKPRIINYDKIIDMKNLLQEGDICYFLDLTPFEKSYIAKKSERDRNKKGMILQGDEEFYKKLAKENIERYKKIIAKNKAEQAAKQDKLVEQVKDTINKVMELSIKIFQGGPKYADLQYSISSLIEKINSKQIWNSKGKSTGSDGLLYIFNEYLSASLDVSKNGGYDFQRRNIEIYKNKLNQIIQNIEQKITDIESKL